jgi:hypothetical protein
MEDSFVCDRCNKEGLRGNGWIHTKISLKCPETGLPIEIPVCFCPTCAKEMDIDVSEPTNLFLIQLFRRVIRIAYPLDNIKDTKGK